MDNERSIRWNMLISGTVQRVGFRHIIQGIARRHRITGCIKNLEGYDVQIIAEGNSEDLAHFKDEIRIQDYPVYVESIDVSEEPFTGEYSYFEIARGTPEEELAERFDSAIAIFSRMEKKQDISIDLGRETVSLQKESLSLQKDTLGLQKETIGLQKETLGLQKETLGLQKETLGLQKETLSLQNDTISLQKETLGLQKDTLSLQNDSISLQKETLGLQKDTLSLQNDSISLQKETLHEVKGIRQDLNKTLTQEIAEVKEELREIRSALIQAGIMRYAHS